MSRDNVYGLLKISLQVVREHGKFEKTTIENMIKEIDAQFDNNYDEKLQAHHAHRLLRRSKGLRYFLNYNNIF